LADAGNEESRVPQETNTTGQSSGSNNPTVSIYQNSEHVAGLVQQLFDAPLITEAIREDQNSTSNTGSVDGSLSVEADARLKVPFSGSGGAQADLKGAGSRSKVVATGSKSTQSFVYSQAYYLNTVRRALG
jgi:hypothetical protein